MKKIFIGKMQPLEIIKINIKISHLQRRHQQKKMSQKKMK